MAKIFPTYYRGKRIEVPTIDTREMEKSIDVYCPDIKTCDKNNSLCCEGFENCVFNIFSKDGLSKKLMGGNKK